MAMIYALVLTIIIEGVAMFILTRSKEWVKCNILCNMVTNPILNISLFVLVYFTGLSWYSLGVFIGEAIVFTSEALLYKLMTGKGILKCIIYSVITNALSLVLGNIIFEFVL